MTTAELKLKLFRKIDSLSAEKLQSVYGMILNYLNNQDSTEEWEAMREAEKQAIMEGIDQLDQEKTVSHETVLKEARKKYKNE